MTGLLRALSRLLGQETARANAGSAAAELGRRRRELLEAEAFVEERSRHPEAAGLR